MKQFINLFLSIGFFVIWINAENQQFQFGIINHEAQWAFHCPKNYTKILKPPSNDQPLISYECPYKSSLIEILPMEIDFTVLCRLQSRLIWIMIDLYQYNTYFWLINNENFQIKIFLNNKIELNNSKIELKNYTNRFIIINAFYIPFELIESLLNQTIEINIKIININQLNQCQFLLQNNYLWKKFLNENCSLDKSLTFFISYSQCEFYSNKFQLTDNTNLNVEIINNKTIINENQLININSKQNQTLNLISYLLFEENSQQILLRIIRISILLKLIFCSLLIILLILIIFFLYMIYYHYHIRSKRLSI